MHKMGQSLTSVGFCTFGQDEAISTAKLVKTLYMKVYYITVFL